MCHSVWTIIVIVKKLMSLRVLGEVKMMTLNEIYKTNEIGWNSSNVIGN